MASQLTVYSLCQFVHVFLHAANHERNPDAMTAGELRATLEKANKLFKGVRAPAEAVLDSNFLMMTGDMAMYQARKVKVGADYFDTDDFINKLKASISGPIRTAADAGSSKKKKGVKRQSDDEDEQDPDYDGVVVDPYSGWDKIGKLATKHSLRVPPVDFM